MLLIIFEDEVIYLVVVVNVNEIICRVLLDIGVVSFYVLVILVKYFGKELVRIECKRIDMMFCLIN